MESVSDIEKVIWQLIQVKDELKADKKVSLAALHKSITDLDETAKRFIAHFHEFEHITGKVSETLDELLLSSSEQAANQIVSYIHHTLDDKLNEILAGLKTSTYQAEHALSRARSEKRSKGASLGRECC